MPDIPALAGFAKACQGLGWVVHRTEAVSREEAVSVLARLASEHPPNGEVVLVSGDPPAIDAVRKTFAGPLTVVDDLSAVPELRPGV